MTEVEQGKGLCPSCNGRLLPLIQCDSCGIKTVREELQPVQEAEKCPVCDSSARVVFECEECPKTYTFDDIMPEKVKKHICPMCGEFVDPDAKNCPSCGSSFAVEELEEGEPREERLRKQRKVIGEFVEDDVLEIMRIPGVGRLRAEILCRAGYTTLTKLNRASIDELAKVRQIGMRTAKSIKEALQMMYVEPEESQRLIEESMEEEFECPVCRTIVSAYDTECSECGTTFERVIQDEAFIEEMEKVGEEKSSLSLFDMKLLESPKDPELWVARGGLLRKMENYEEALKSYERALAIQPKMKSAWIAKAEILSKLGRLDEAASCYREIVDDSATAAGFELGKEEEAMVALEELLAEDCPSCGSSIPLGSDTCPSCGLAFVPKAEELPLESLEEDVVTEELLEEEMKEKKIERVSRQITKGTGLTNGKGRINGTGLVNGRGRINGTGMVNGKGLVNGKGIINGKGRVNGLIDGNGFTNGLSLSNIARGTERRVWPRYMVLGVALILLVLVLYGMVPQAVERVSPITIDGQFEDWDKVSTYNEQGQGPNPDTSITDYGFSVDNGYLSFLIGVQGDALGDLAGYDSFYVFIDQDNDPNTGYIVRDMGAEYMIEVFGGAGEVVSVPMYGYVNTQDRLNFTQWNHIASGKAAANGNQLEGQLISNGRFDISSDFRILFSADDYEGGTDSSSVKIGPEYGALLITQDEYGPNAILGSGSNEIMTLRLEAKGVDVHVESISFEVSGAQAQPITLIDIEDGSTVTRAIVVDTTQSTSGGLIGISVSDVVTDTPYTVQGTGAKAYFASSPSEPQVDGWFGEWDQQTETDSDTSPVVNPNVDILESGIIKNEADDTAYFYLEIEDELLGGYSSPQVRPKAVPTGEPGQPAPPVTRLDRIGGEDRTYIYIDSDTSDNTTGTLVPGLGIMSDRMIRIEGIYGRITNAEICHWSPGWNCTGNLEAEKDMSKIEVGARNLGISSAEMSVVFASTDWNHRGDFTLPSSRAEDSRGQGGPEPMAPSWPATWISVVTDADDLIEPSLDILEVYFRTDASYLYVRVRTDYRNLPPTITNHTWFIYLDTDGNNANDWVVVEMSGSGTGEVHGLAWNVGGGSWGVPGSNWYDSISDVDVDSAARATTMDVSGTIYGCIDFAVLSSNIGSISDDANIQAATNKSEDHNMTGNTDNIPPGQGFPLEYEDITPQGQIPEFDIILIPISLSIVIPTVMIKRRKRYSGS